MAVEPLELRRSSLIVWDMQMGIAGLAFNRAALVPVVADLIAAYRARGLPVIFSQHTSPPEGWANPAMARSMARRGLPAGGVRFTAGAAEWSILAELAPRPEELVLPKATPSFFVGTPLESLLRVRGIDTLVLTGVSTDGGIMGTARHAVNLGFFALVVEDGVGAMTAEAHSRALEVLRALCDVETSPEVIARLPARA